MAKLNSYSRIISTDFETEQQPIVEKLGSMVNDGFTPVYSALSNRLTFSENFLCTEKEVEITVGATGIPLTRTSLSLSNTLPVKAALVLAISNKTNAAGFPTGAPFITFSQNGNVLFIDHITGLLANNRYLIRILALNQTIN